MKARECQTFFDVVAHASGVDLIQTERRQKKEKQGGDVWREGGMIKGKMIIQIRN